MFKVCVIGCGAHSKVAYGPSLASLASENPSIHLAGCCDRDGQRAREYGKTFGFEKNYESAQEMIETLRPHGICIVLPVEMMAKTISSLAQYPIPMLVEKPPASGVAQMKKIIAATQGIPVQVAFNRRYVPLLIKLKEEMDKGAVRFLEYDLSRVMRCEESFYTTAIHAIDAVRYLTDSDYEGADITYQPLSAYGEGVSNVYITGKMKNDVQVRLNLCPVSGAVVERVKVICDEKNIYVKTPLWLAYDKPGSLVIQKEDQKAYALRGADLPGSDNLEVSSGFYGEIKAFIKNTAQGRPLTPTLEESLQSITLCETISKKEKSFIG